MARANASNPSSLPSRAPVIFANDANTRAGSIPCPRIVRTVSNRHAFVASASFNCSSNFVPATGVLVVVLAFVFLGNGSVARSSSPHVSLGERVIDV